MRPKKRSFTVLLTLAALLSCALPALADPGTPQHFTANGDELLLVNLIGEIRIRPGDGPAFELEVTRDGHDADRIEVVVNDGSQARVLIRFPVKEERRYVYPRMGFGSSSTFSLEGLTGKKESWLELLGWTGTDQIKVSGRGHGLEAWADVTVRVPAGKRVEVRHGIGSIAAEGTAGDLALDICSGSISVSHLHGSLLADTGSGSVQLSDVTGAVKVDTGSGSVDLSDCSGPQIDVDTGSGSVDAARIECEELVIDTGSGTVHALGIGADTARIDTGSGSVDLKLTRIGSGRFLVDTGSGSIDLYLPPDASAVVNAETGAGSVDADVDAAHILASDEGSLSLRIGDGAAARVDLDTGSGSIHISQ